VTGDPDPYTDDIILLEPETPDEDLLSAFRGMYYDRIGREINLKEWTVLWADPDYRRVRSTRLHGEWISTVWVGMNYGIGRDPEVFETMVFSHRRRYSNRAWDTWQDRYGSLEEAVLGHDRLVDFIRSRGLGIFGPRRKPYRYKRPTAYQRKRDRHG